MWNTLRYAGVWADTDGDYLALPSPDDRSPPFVEIRKPNDARMVYGWDCRDKREWSKED